MATKSLPDEIADFLEEKARTKSEATAYQYGSVLERIFLPWARSAGISEAIQCDDNAMKKFQGSLEAKRNGKGEPLSKATLRTYIRAVRVFLTWADVPKGKYQGPRKEGKRLRDTLSGLEIDAMERAALDERDKLIIRVLGDSGVRVSELLGLRPEDLRESGRVYQIRVIGKGDDQRDVPIPPSTFRRLRNLADHCPPNPGFIFVSRRLRHGRVEQLTKSGVEQLVRHLAERAGINRRVWPHLFRHSYTTRLARQGVDMEAVRKALGHRSLTMILDVYSHVTAADANDAIMRALKA